MIQMGDNAQGYQSNILRLSTPTPQLTPFWVGIFILHYDPQPGSVFWKKTFRSLRSVKIFTHQKFCLLFFHILNLRIKTVYSLPERVFVCQLHKPPTVVLRVPCHLVRLPGHPQGLSTFTCEESSWVSQDGIRKLVRLDGAELKHAKYMKGHIVIQTDAYMFLISEAHAPKRRLRRFSERTG